MGATITSSNPADFTNRLQTYFNPKLLASIQEMLHLSDYGLKQKFPAHGTSIRFFRPRGASAASVAAITEGTTPANLTEVAVGYVDISLAQRGALAKITDIVQAVDLLNTVQLYVKTMGSDAALDFDTVVRNALTTALNDSNATFGSGHPFERMAGIAPTDVSSTDFATFNALSTANGKITRSIHLGCVTRLKASKVPMIDGNYVAVTPPQVIHDIRQDTTWVAASTYRDTQNLYKREQIRLDGAAFVEHTNPFIEGAVYKTYNGAGTNFTTYYLGDGAFGVPQLDNDKAGSAPMGPKMVILAAPDKTDPLNLICTVGWKSYYGCAALVTNLSGEIPRHLSLRTKSTF